MPLRRRAAFDCTPAETAGTAQPRPRWWRWRTCGAIAIRRGRSYAAFRSGSFAGEPICNSTGPLITAKVWPERFTYQRRSPRVARSIAPAPDVLSLSSIIPPPQRPFDRAVDAGVRVAAMERQKLADERLALGFWQLVQGVSPEGLDQRPPRRSLGMKED